MNRREQRNLKMQNKEATYLVKQKDVERTVLKYANEINKDAVDKTYSWTIASTLIVLREEFGFGKQRMTKAMDLIELQFNLIKEKNITGQELIKFVEDYGVKFKER